MKSFFARHASKIKGVLHGFDRIRFRGTLRWLANTKGMMSWLWNRQVLLKDFKPHAIALTDQIDEESRRIAQSIGQAKEIYLPSSNTSKEDVAKRLAAERGIREGLVCVLKCVEPARTFKVESNPHTKHIELRSHPGRCSHYYFYYAHPEFGWIHVRLQSWLPFTIHMVINGRDWLGRQLMSAGVPFEKRDNCFVDIGDLSKAQSLLTAQLRTNWETTLEDLRRLAHPTHEQIFGTDLPNYYWSADETEWATDVMFRSPAELDALYPQLVHHGVTTFSCGDVLHFLGRRPHVQMFSAADVYTDLKTRPEGTRLKHTLNHNSIKMYDKQESVLRIETTVNDARGMMAYRTSEADPEGPKQWRKMRKGVADLPRRAEISQASNERYLEALGNVEQTEPLKKMMAPLVRPAEWNGRRVRALNPLAKEDNRLLLAINRPEFNINGFRNQDLRTLMFDEPASPTTIEGKRQSTKVTRLLRLLRAHKLITKIPKTHRYKLTKQGSRQIIAILTAQNASTKTLTELAA